MRYFFAIIPPEEIKKGIQQLCFGIRGAKWEGFEKFHITLRFMEKVEPTALKRLLQLAKNANCSEFSLRLMDLGHFPLKKKPRVLWMGVDLSPELLDFQKKLEIQVARKAGLPPEGRRFHPHLTLARLKGDCESDLAAFYAQNLPLGFPSFKVDSFYLIHSQLNPRGSKYHVVEEFPLVKNWKSVRK